MTPHAMTDEQLRVRVATLLGWNSIYYEGGKMCGCFGSDLETTRPVPNWPVDLNACATMEEHMDDDQRLIYMDFLWGVANGEKDYKSLCEFLDGHPNEWHSYNRIRAKARQRCIAFVMAIEYDFGDGPIGTAEGR